MPFLYLGSVEKEDRGREGWKVRGGEGEGRLEVWKERSSRRQYQLLYQKLYIIIIVAVGTRPTRLHEMRLSLMARGCLCTATAASMLLCVDIYLLQHRKGSVEPCSKSQPGLTSRL